ncbi:MAG TPA: cytochrome c [Bacillales bacterium]|nr:cytochrome c [Bacillales bacterium]
MRKKLLALLMGTILVMGLAACGGGSDTDKTESAETIASQKCFSCHGDNLKGAIGPNLQKIGSKYSKDEILDILKNGKGTMPPNIVTGSDAEKIATWLSEKK